MLGKLAAAALSKHDFSFMLTQESEEETPVVEGEEVEGEVQEEEGDSLLWLFFWWVVMGPYRFMWWIQFWSPWDYVAWWNAKDGSLLIKVIFFELNSMKYGFLSPYHLIKYFFFPDDAPEAEEYVEGDDTVILDEGEMEPSL